MSGKSIKIMEKEYLVLGDNNYWYATCGTLAEAKQEAKNCEELDFLEKPDKVYIYEAIELKRVSL